jgi:hypothetical protein
VLLGHEALLILQVCAILEGAKLLISSAGRPKDTQRELHAALAHDNNWRLIQMTKRSYVDVLLKILELIEGFPRGLRMCYIGLVPDERASRGFWLSRGVSPGIGAAPLSSAAAGTCSGQRPPAWTMENRISIARRPTTKGIGTYT